MTEQDIIQLLKNGQANESATQHLLQELEVRRGQLYGIGRSVAEGIVACAKPADKAEDGIDTDTRDTTVNVGDKTVAGKLIGGTTYVPLRDIVEALRPTVAWTAEEGARVTL
ncbi:MAG: hypothetical protein GXX99_02580 [Clostridiales bacterium]|nr:hypothetical protein [Clostridiales bacterium]